MKKIMLSIMLLSLCYAGCEDNDIPIAKFATDVDIFEVGEEVKFYNSSRHADTYLWDFGDGTTSTDFSPFHKYQSPGKYNVSLTAFNDGFRNVAYKEIEITSTTELRVFVKFKGIATPADACLVDVYGSFEDYQAKQTSTAVVSGQTNNEGYVTFYNLGSKVYYIDVFKKVNGGYYGNDDSPYVTEKITAGNVNTFNTEVEFFSGKK